MVRCRLVCFGFCPEKMNVTNTFQREDSPWLYNLYTCPPSENHLDGVQTMNRYGKTLRSDAKSQVRK